MYKLFVCVSFTKYTIPAFLWNLFLSSQISLFLPTEFYFPISSLSLPSLSFLSPWWLCSVHPLSFVSGSGNISQDVWLIHHLDNQKEKKTQFPAMNIYKKHQGKKPLTLNFPSCFSLHFIWESDLTVFALAKVPLKLLRARACQD